MRRPMTCICSPATIPHVEGGKDPIGRFEKALGERQPETRDNFYAENFLRLFPNARTH